MSASTNAFAQINNTEIVEKKVDIETAISRMRRPLDQTTINLEVYGVYALPEQWKSKIDDPNESLYTYELEIAGISIRNAKLCPKELSEEEKAEIEAAKNTKGKQPPPKDPKKKDEEPSKEELDKIEKERKEKEDKEKKLKDEWDALDEDTKFYRTHEDIYKEPCIKFNNVGAIKRIEALNQQLAQVQEDEEQKKEIQEVIRDLTNRLFIGHVACQKNSYELIEFEEMVSKDKGCWIRFNKLTPPEEEILDPKAAAAKKAPPKGGKGTSSEDLKPQFGMAWVSFEDLLVPGGLETKQRVYLQTCPPLIKKVGDDGVEKYVHAEEYENVFEQQRTYIYLKLTLTDPITPTIPEFPEPQPHEVVPVKQFIRWPFSKDPTDDFKKQISLAIESLAKEYFSMFQNELQTEAAGGKSDHEITESFEERKKEFLYEINTSGKYHILKEKLKKTIVRIVKEYFKMTGSIKGLKKDERDHFYSTLYAYLVNQMRQTVQQLVEKKKNELHENITVPKELYQKEKDNLIEQFLQESQADRYKRLSDEYENLYCNIAEAENYMLKYIGLFEGDPEKMLEIGKFYLRIGKPDKANDYLRDAYSFQIKNQNIALTYASFLIQQTRSKEAIVILNRLALEKYNEAKVNLLLSLAYEMDSDPLMAEKYKAVSAIIKLRQNGLIQEEGQQYQSKPQSQPPLKIQPGQQPPVPPEPDQNNYLESKPGFNGHRLSQQDLDQLYLDLASYLNEVGLFSLSKKVIDQIKHVEPDNVQTFIAYHQLSGQVNLLRKSYDEAVADFQGIINLQPYNIQAFCSMGHCYFFQKNYDAAEQAYLKVFRYSDFTQQQITDEYIYSRLAALYVAQEKFSSARVFVQEALEQKENSYSLFQCAILLIHFNLNDVGNSLLSRANVMDPQNPDIWGYIALVRTIQNRKNYCFQALKESFKLKLSNMTILKKILYELKIRDYYELYRETAEFAFRARAFKDTSIRHQEKVEEFLKNIQGVEEPAIITQKYRELLVKTNCLKEEDDELYQQFIETQKSKQQYDKETKI